MVTREDLEIIWNAPDGQSQAPGIYLYGFFPRGLIDDIDIPMDRLVRQIRASYQGRIIEHKTGLVAKVVVRFGWIPDDDLIWLAFLEDAFTILLAAGASVAWAGGIDCSSSPGVLNPKSNEGNVYAAKSAESTLLCNAKLNEPIEFLSDEKLMALWKIVNPS
jgi:hypothetical protein